MRIGLRNKFILMAALCAGAISLAWMSPVSASVITGNPTVDSGWTQVGNTLQNGNYADQAGMYDANMYSTAFLLDPSSPLISTLNGEDWNAGDTIVGVGGFFVTTTAIQNGWTGTYSTSPNSNLTYDGTAANTAGVGSTSTRIVVKYGASAAPSGWKVSTIKPTSGNGVAALASGGNGSVLLGTNPYDFGPSDAGTLIVPSDSPEIVAGGSGVMIPNGDIGRVITAWSGGTLLGFESFLDLTLLNSEYSASSTPPSVSVGNEFDLDLQRGTNSTEIVDALANLPASVPEPASFGLICLAGVGILSRRKRRA
jgi:hypothetical protein